MGDIENPNKQEDKDLYKNKCSDNFKYQTIKQFIHMNSQKDVIKQIPCYEVI